MKKQYEASDRESTFVSHAFEEHLVDLGEVRMNYVRVGSPNKPALLLIPGQTESWWGYEKAMPLLAEHFEAFAVDLRGQGRSTWTPGRYTLDNMGNDLVRFIDLVIGRPTIVSGFSSGGVLSAWLSAYAKPGQVRGASLRRSAALLVRGEHRLPAQSIRQGIGPVFALFNKYLGDQWSVNNWKGMRAAAATELPPSIAFLLCRRRAVRRRRRTAAEPEGIRPGMGSRVLDRHGGRELRPRADAVERQGAGAIDASLPDERRANGRCKGRDVRRPGHSACAIWSPRRANRIDYVSLPMMGHVMHQQDPNQFVKVLMEWAAKLQ